MYCVYGLKWRTEKNLKSNVSDPLHVFNFKWVLAVTSDFCVFLSVFFVHQCPQSLIIHHAQGSQTLAKIRFKRNIFTLTSSFLFTSKHCCTLFCPSSCGCFLWSAFPRLGLCIMHMMQTSLCRGVCAENFSPAQGSLRLVLVSSPLLTFEMF